MAGNTSRATLTTGTPQYGAMGTLDSFLVQGGTVTINGNGLDLSTTDYAAILSRALQVNAAIYASELRVVTGANQVSADHAQVTPTAGTGTAPTFALDVSALGGMYAKKITLIGIPDGTSNTLLFAEKYARCGAGGSLWGQVAPDLWQPVFAAWSKGLFQVRPTAAECDPQRASTPFAGGIQVALADASVRSVSPGVRPETWWAACTPAGGEVLGGDW